MSKRKATSRSKAGERPATGNPTKSVKAAARMLAAAFTPNPIRYGTMRGYEPATERKISATTLQPITEEMVMAHLNLPPGEQIGRVGWLPGREDYTDVIALDVDKREQDQAEFDEVVGELLQACEKLGLTTYVEISTHGGVHLWTFLSEGISWEQAYWVAKAVTIEAGHPYIETFPSSASSGAAGKWIYIPYAGAMHPDTTMPGLGEATYLTDPMGRPVEVWALPNVARVPKSRALKIANGAKLKLRELMEEAEATGELMQDLDTGAFAELKASVMSPPVKFRRHDSVAAFLNLGMRAGQLEGMHELLASREVYDLWINDSSRSYQAWVEETDRWTERIRRDTGELRSRYGIKSLLEQGWTIGNLSKRPEVDFSETPDLNKVPDMDLARILYDLMRLDNEHWWFDPDMMMGYRWDGRTYVAKQHWEDEIKRWIDHRAALLGKNIREGKLTAVYQKLERNFLRRPLFYEQDPDLIACENGVLNWRTGELLDPSPDIATIGRVKAAWDPSVDVEQAWRHTEWTQFLTGVLAIEDPLQMVASVESMAEFFGYCLMPLNPGSPATGIRKILNFHGPSSTGKTTTWRAVLSVLGDQADQDNSGLAMSSDQELFNSQDWAQKLVGKRLVVFDEMNTGGREGRRIVNALKILAGNGAVTINPKGKRSVQARLGTRIMMCTNYRLTLFEDSSNDAFFRRLIRVPFNKVVDRTEERADYEGVVTRNPEVRNQMFIWMVDGLRRLAANGWRFEHDQRLSVLLADDREDANPLIQFLQQRARPIETNDPGRMLATTDILHAYNAWAGENGLYQLSSIALGHRLHDALGQFSWGKQVHRVVKSGYRLWQGLEVLDSLGEPVQGSTHPQLGGSSWRGDRVN